MDLALICLGAVALDSILGQPQRWHPLAGFVQLTRWTDHFCYGPDPAPDLLRRALGVVSLMLVVTPFVALSWALSTVPYLGTAVEMALLYLALGVSRIVTQSGAVARALQDVDYAVARREVQVLVARDTADLNEEGLGAATVEAILKGGCERFVAALLWFVAAGSPGVVAYRLAAEVSWRWGYSTPRYRHFGWAAVRLHAILNWIPARVTAACYGLLGDRAAAWRSWRSQAGPRSGSTVSLLAAGAGALGLQLGGPVHYFEQLVVRPSLGEGVVPRNADIGRALELLGRTLGVWMALVLGAAWWLP